MAAANLYGEKLGLVFQIIDDILDVTATAEQLGKSVGSDAQNHKTTYVTLYGVEGARKMARQISQEGACALAGTRLDQPFFPGKWPAAGGENKINEGGRCIPVFR